MPGLLSDVLPAVYRAGDWAKKRVNSLLDDPIGDIQQTLGKAGDDLRQLGLLSQQAYGDKKDPLKVTDQQAARQLANTYLGAVMNFAPVGMFVGPSSKTWDKIAAEQAQKLESKGIDPRSIWKETGTFKGADGMWRQEISDHNIRPLDRTWGESADLKAGDRTTTVRQRALAHPQLSAAYPDTKQIGVMIKPGENKSASYLSDPAGGLFDDTIFLSVSPKYNYKADPSTMLHELQHAIQRREGWATGGSPTDADLMPYVRKIYSDNIGNFIGESHELINMAKDRAYRNLAGEVEARATQARMNMNAAQRRDVFPFDSYDVPQDQLIVRRSP